MRSFTYRYARQRVDPVIATAKNRTAAAVSRIQGRMVVGAMSMRARIVNNGAAPEQKRLALINTPSISGQMPRRCQNTPNTKAKPAVLSKDARKSWTVGSTVGVSGNCGSLELVIHVQ